MKLTTDNLLLLKLLIATVLLTLAGKCDPDDPNCLDSRCKYGQIITHPDSTTEVIVEIYPGLDSLTLLGSQDTFYKLIFPDGSEPVWLEFPFDVELDDYLLRGYIIVDTVVTGKVAFIEELNNLLFVDEFSPITDVGIIDTCKCEAEIFLLRADTPQGVDLNNGVAAGTSNVKQENKGAIKAAGFNYTIDIGLFNEASLAPKRPPGSQPVCLVQKPDTTSRAALNTKCRNVDFTPRPDTNKVVVALVDTGVDPTYNYLPGGAARAFALDQEEAAGVLNAENTMISYGAAWNGNNTDDNGNCLPDDFYGYDYFHLDNNPTDVQGHGTHINDIILTANGSKTDVRVMPLQFAGYPDGSDKYSCDLFAGICAINYATNNGADIINLSFGYYSSTPNGVLREQLRKATEKDILIVTSAGNDSILVDNCKHWPSSYSNFTDLSDAVISVAALDKIVDGEPLRLASYSNYGRTVDVAAPGTEIYAALVGSLNERIPLDGTSMAAGVISRQAAKLRYSASGDKRSAAEIKQMILGYTTELPNACVAGGRALDVHYDPTLLSSLK